MPVAIPEVTKRIEKILALADTAGYGAKSAAGSQSGDTTDKSSVNRDRKTRLNKENRVAKCHR